MAAKKKTKATKKRATAKKRVAGKAAKPIAADVRKLDSGWQSFIRKAVKDEPLTLEWHDPVGAPSTRTTINADVAQKAAGKAAKKSRTLKPAAKKNAKKKAAKKK